MKRQEYIKLIIIPFLIFSLILTSIPANSIDIIPPQYDGFLEDNFEIFPYPKNGDGYISKEVKFSQAAAWVESIDAQVGDLVDFRITIETSGGHPLEDIEVCDYLPLGIQLLGATPSPDGYTIEQFYDPSTGCLNYFYKYQWSFSNIHNGETKTIILNTEIVDFPLLSIYCFNGTNVATIHATERSSGCDNVVGYVNESDSANVNVFRLGLSKYVYNDSQTDPYAITSNWRKSTTVNISEIVKFKLIVRNTGNKILHNVVVEDYLPVFLVYNSGSANYTPALYSDHYIIWNLGNLDIGELVEITFTATATCDGEADNLAIATSQETSPLEDTAHVIVLSPCTPIIDVSKEADIDVGYAGDLVTYTIIVKNDGCGSLYDVWINDTTLGISFYIDELEAGGERTYYAEHVIDCCVDPFVNTVCAEGHDRSGKLYSDCDTESVDVICGGIDVTKEGNITVGYPGDVVNYTIVVENIGQDDLYDVLVEDIALGFSHYIGFLEAGGSRTFYLEYVLNCCVDPFVNVVEAEGFDVLGFRYFDSDDWSVDVICNGIDVTKEGNITVGYAGDVVNYSLTVENVGQDDLFGVWVNDSDLGVDFYVGYLGAGESRVFYVEHMLDCCVDPFVNVVEAEGFDEFGSRYFDSDDWSVDVVCAGIEVDKEGDITVGYAGDVVTYTIVVENIGQEDLYDVLVEDSALGFSQYIGFLGAGEIKTYYLEHTLDCCNDPFINVVDVEGYDILGKLYSDSDTWTVDVICDFPEKNVSILKNVKFNCCGIYSNYTTANIGDFVTFMINVTNTGETDLDLSIIDELPYGLEYNDYITYDYKVGNKYYWNYSDVAPGEKISIVFKADVVDCGYLINNVTVVDVDHIVFKKDTAVVEVDCPCQPGISIDKKIWDDGQWVDELYVDDYPLDVNFKIIIENTGTCDLEDLIVNDRFICGLEDPRDFSKQPDELGNDYIIWSYDSILIPGEKRYIEFKATAYKNTTNFVNVTCFDQSNSEILFDEDACYIYKQVIPNYPPSVEITKPLENSIYLLNKKMNLPFGNTLIIGGIEVKAEASDEDGIDRVEFYIDDGTEPREVQNQESCNWTWDEKIFGYHKIKVIAYDTTGLENTDEIRFFIINLGIL